MLWRAVQTKPKPTTRAFAALRLLSVALFLLLVGRFWHPYYGLTSLLQCDPSMASRMLPVLRRAPIFVQPGPGGYDGFYYAEIATDPSLRDPDLGRAVDDLGYRGRRILASAAAYALGSGDPARAVRAYPWINVAAWLLLAALLWRVFPLDGWRGFAGWFGVLFSYGAMVSVRLSVPDLPALALVACGVAAGERGGSLASAALIGLSGLGRETSVLAAASLASGRAGPGRLLARMAVALLPLLAWVLYVAHVAGSSGPGIANFGFPLSGIAAKVASLAGILAGGRPLDVVLAALSLLSVAAVAAQAAYIALVPEAASAWWRVGAAYCALLLVLGPSPWGTDLPGAFVRVLLPLLLAFNVLAVRRRAAAAWFALGNLSVAGGLFALLIVASHPREFASGRIPGGSFVADLGEGWYGPEALGGRRWSWCAGDAAMELRTWPTRREPLALNVTLRALSERPVEISAGSAVLWRGPVGTAPTAARIVVPADAGSLRFRSPAPPQREGAGAGARLLSFECLGLDASRP
jgi:hypothetical protein